MSQQVLAGQLGVPAVGVAQAEAKTREKLRPALQVSVKVEMEPARAARLAQWLAVAAPTQEKGADLAVQAEPVVVAPAEAVTATPADSPPVSPDASPAAEALTGADLACWRPRRRWVSS